MSAVRPRVRTVRSMLMRDDFREYFHRQAMTLHMQVDAVFMLSYVNLRV